MVNVDGVKGFRDLLDFGHFAVDKTLAKLRETYWFPGIKRYVRRYIAASIECLFHKTPYGTKPAKLHSIEKVAKPFHTVDIDHFGPFVRNKPRKLRKQYKGPFLDMEQLPNDHYRIKDFPGRQRTRRHYSSIAPVDKIKPWSADDFISEDSDDDSDRDGR